MPSCVRKVTAQKAATTAIPVLKILNDTSITALQISKLSINITVTGNIATTTFDISYYNNTDKVLEGEFDFALADGQNICRYALDINGTLREGVVVEKAKARAAYENTVRKNVDPGLVEKTAGNNFRTRIYPIPAKGYKRVVIGIEQTLVSVKDGLAYSLPLHADYPITEFAVHAAVIKPAAKPDLQNNTLANFNFNKEGETWFAKFSGANYTPDNTITFILLEKDIEVYTEKFEGSTYFYSHLPAVIEFQDKINPSSITLLWDISASAEKRNIKKELALLKLYVQRLGNVTINLVPFNITTLPSEKFDITNGDATALLQRLQSFSFDGGTQLGALNLTQFSAAEILLFTDGLSTFGKKELILSSSPVTVINSAASANYSYLKFIALHSNGKFINLTASEPETVINEIIKEPLQFINATYNTDEITEFYPQVNAQLQNGFSVTGILKKEQAAVILNFGFGGKITSSKTIIIKNNAGDAGNIKRIWASTKIDQLDLEYEKNKDTITQLGKRFSIVTQNTSLLVLDRVEDYLDNDIVPPVELQKEYFTLLKERQKNKADEKAATYNDAIAEMAAMKEWYNKKIFPFAKKGVDTYSLNYTSVGNGSTQTATNYAYSVTDSASVQYDALTADNYKTNATMADMEVKAEQFTPPLIVKDEVQKTTAPTAEIQLSEWAPETPYLKAMNKTLPAKYVEQYFLLKKEYTTQPSFFVDMARFFFEKNNKDEAVLVLSNIAEMKLENPELLRIVANQLMEFGEKDLAIEVFKEVLTIREEEPQSYRDLGLAYNETGKYQQAVDLLYKVVQGKWDDRFGGVKAIAMNEINAIISAHPAEINTTGIDKKFIQAMPLDVRIVISWSSNDSDIDLWVTDPAKEKCFYENTTTNAGGKISRDVTQGYGPEEFCIKKAAKGDYTVDVNLYGDHRQTLGGPITIKAEMFTNFGKPSQKRKVINFRVTTNKEVIRIGVLHFDAN
jgi:tetratricopeptide (TPR) repeat protein